jgi:ParB family transcriptional regulator, chromosome partitioning protein
MRETIEIGIDQIRPNRNQPRVEFNNDAIYELAQSIRENGLIQPIVVRKVDNHYEIIAGERRYRAMQMLGYTTVTALVSHANDAQSAQMAIIENIQREDLTAIEEAKAYQTIMKANGWTQEKIASLMGKSQSAIANKIRLLQLPPLVQQAVLDKKITERHARALLQVKADQQIPMLDIIIKQDLTVSATEAKIKNIEHVKPNKPISKGLVRHVMIVKNTLMQAVGMIQKSNIDIKVSEKDQDGEWSMTITVKK